MKTAEQSILIELSDGNIIRDKLTAVSYAEVSYTYLEGKLNQGVERIGTQGTWMGDTYYPPSMIRTIKREGEVRKGIMPEKSGGVA